MTTNAFLGGIAFARQNVTTSPETWDALEEINDLPSIGETAPLVNVTHFGSTSMEYIAGLADGDEFTISCNRVHASPSVQDAFIAEKGLTKTYRVVHTDTSVSPNTVKTYTFSAVNLGWSLSPSIEDKNSIGYTFKLSGGITIT